jgi:maltose/moltooligosaccharide transporter
MIIALPNIGAINEFLGVGSILAVAIVVALTLDLAINISFNPTRSIIADVTPDGVPRTKGYTWMQTISGFWGVMAYAIGAIFGNYFLIYLGAIIVLGFSFIPPFFIKESEALTNDEKETVITEKKSKVTQWGELFKLYFAHAFSWIGVQTMFVYIIAFIQQKLNPSTETETGQIIAISFLVLNAVGFILPAFVLEPITEKMGRVKTHLVCVAIMSVGYFGIVLIGTSAIILYIFMAVCGIGWAAIVSLPFAIMSEKVDESRMGFFMGVFNLSVVLPQLIVSLVLGYFIQEAQDKNLIFIISGTTLAISAILWLLVKEKQVQTTG